MASRRKGHVRMRWLRSNIKRGSRLALFALAVQFALSFGHFHGVAARAAPAIESDTAPAESPYPKGLAAANEIGDAAQERSPSNHDSDRQPSDTCAICAVIALANAALFATPPALPLPQAVELLYLITDAEFVHLNSARMVFQPRAPPLS